MAIRQPTRKIQIPRRPRWQSRHHGVRMSEEAYLSLPEEKPYLEYVDGMVSQKPMANYSHTRLAAELIVSLGIYGRANGGVCGPENRVKMGELPNYRLPDVSYWGPGRRRGNDTVPTLAVEIRSPDQTMDELRAKCREFRRAGVDVCWLLDPRSRSAETFEGRSDARRIDSGTLTSRHLPGLEVPLDELSRVLDEA